MKNRFVLFALLALTACTIRPKLTGPEVAMRPTEDAPVLEDDLPFEPLLAGIQQNIDLLEKKADQEAMVFGPRVVAKADYIQSLKYLQDVLRTHSKLEALSAIQQDFEFFEIYGDTDWGEVFMTSYYDPVIKGSPKKTDVFSQPLYAVPDDLVTIRFGEFLEAFPRLRLEMNAPHEQKTQGEVLRGRIVKQDGDVPHIVPYFSREHIDTHGALSGKKLELVWVDPIKAFSLQIQGSGIVELPDGRRMRVGYAAQNGHSYVPIGRFLLDAIPLEKMSMQAIEAHLASLPKEKMQEILNMNPSYVFFRKLENTRSLTYLGAEVVSGRTIATDYRYFPKGAVGYLEFEEPVFPPDAVAAGVAEPTGWSRTGRLVLDQDTGGAIRGAHRLDLYWGEGDEAERSAGVMRRHGRLYYLVPKAELLDRLASVRPPMKPL